MAVNDWAVGAVDGNGLDEWLVVSDGMGDGLLEDVVL